MIIKTQELIDACEFLDRIQPQTGLAASQFVRFRPTKEKRVMSLSLSSIVMGERRLEFSSSGEIPSGRLVCVDRRLLFPFIFAAKVVRTKSDFELDIEDTRLRLRHGRRKAAFSLSPDVTGYSSFPKSSSPQLVVRLDKSAVALIQCASACAANDPSTPHLSCVYMRKGDDAIHLLSSNHVIVHRAGLADGPKLKNSVAFPLALVPFIGLSGVREVRWFEGCVSVEFHGGRIWQPNSAQVKEKFPAKTIEKVMDDWSESFTTYFTVQCRHFSSVSARIGAYLGSVRRLDWSLDVRGERGDKAVVLESKLPQCHFLERLLIDRPLRCVVRMRWPLSVLSELFDFIGSSYPKKTLTVSGAADLNSSTPYLFKCGPVSFAVARLAEDNEDKKKK